MATPYIKVAIQITEHPKMLRTPRACRWAYIELLCYAARNLTNGFIPREYAAIACTVEEVDSLTANRLLEVVEGGWQIHGYTDWQTDSELIEKRRESGRKGGIKSGASRRANAKQNAKQNGPESKQTPHERSTSEASASNMREQEVEVEVEVEEQQQPKSTPSKADVARLPPPAGAFDRFWKAYPRKVGKRTAQTAFARALKRQSAEAVIEGAIRLAIDPNLPEREFIPHPTTWLNRDGWEDDPLPERTNGKGPSASRMFANVAMQLATPGLEITP
jgi:hypothetical protein